MYLIQIGCHTGDDTFFQLVQSLGDELTEALVVDALASSVEICKKRYEEALPPEVFDKIRFINMAIVDDPQLTTVTFYFPAGEHARDKDIKYTAFSSTSKEHLISHGIMLVASRTVPAITLDALIKTHKFPKVDRLYLDAEGLDAKILLSTPIQNIEIDFLCFESSHTDGPFRQGPAFGQLRRKLISCGYKLYSFQHSSLNEGYDHAQIDWNVWALKDKSLLDEMVEFSGHKDKIEKAYSRIIEV